MRKVVVVGDGGSYAGGPRMIDLALEANTATAMAFADLVLRDAVSKLPGGVWESVVADAARALWEYRLAGFRAGEACAVDNALNILDEEGWLGESKQRISRLSC